MKKLELDTFDSNEHLSDTLSEFSDKSDVYEKLVASFEEDLKHAEDEIYYAQHTVDTFTFEYRNFPEYFFNRSKCYSTAKDGYNLLRSIPRITVAEAMRNTYIHTPDEYPDKEDPDWQFTWTDKQVEEWRQLQRKNIENNIAFHLAEGAAFARFEKYAKLRYQQLLKARLEGEAEVKETPVPASQVRSRILWTATIQLLLDTLYWLIEKGWIANTPEEVEQFALLYFEIAERKPTVAVFDSNISIKLRWLGSMKQCCDVFRWLRLHGWIDATIDELTHFILSQINWKFESKYGTIRSMIASTDIANRPAKPKRFIDPSGSKARFIAQAKK